MISTRIVAIGASSLFGRIDPEEGGFIGRLKKWHETQAAQNIVFNLGVPGETSSDILKRFSQEVGVRRPDLILISVGLNDTKRKGSKEAGNPPPPDQQALDGLV